MVKMQYYTMKKKNIIKNINNYQLYNGAII